MSIRRKWLGLQAVAAVALESLGYSWSCRVGAKLRELSENKQAAE